MRTNIYKKLEIQSLMDEQMLLEGQLAEIQAKIEEKQIQYLTNTIRDANILLGWHRPEPILKKTIDISPKDKRFSLSSIFSRPSLELMNIQDRKLPIVDKTKFQKKKNNRKNKIRHKPLKSRRIKNNRK